MRGRLARIRAPGRPGMRNPGCELRRISLPRTPVNKVRVRGSTEGVCPALPKERARPAPGGAGGRLSFRHANGRGAGLVGEDRNADAPIRVLLADDHTMFRQGLAGILASYGGMEVVAEVPNDEDALRLAR